MLTIDWAGYEWALVPERALHWPALKTAVVADLHFGKAAAFRHHGVPVPAGTTSHDLERLTSIIRRTGCERLVILGDFLHAKTARADETMRVIGGWRAAHASLDITLVRGNHDHNAGDPPELWRIECKDEPLEIGGLLLRHTPTHAALPTIAGHVHPCVRLRDVDGSSMRVPCFIFTDRSALLPAFGSFTGGHSIRPREGDRVFALGADEVIEVEGVCA